MKNILLNRNDFKELVFKRDEYKCVVCNKEAVDAHHIIDRSLFNDGGYYINNGVSLCEEHHIQAEQTIISCQELRDLAKITNNIYPNHLSFTEFVKDYDKWGNPILKSGKRLKGELFNKENVQKIIKPVLELFEKDYDVTVEKYPRTYHLPMSLGTTSDDRISKNYTNIRKGRTIHTEKLDGENCLDSETLIETEDGIKTIREICEKKYKGKVLSYNHEEECEEFKEIINHSIVDENEDDEWFEIEIENGEKIKLTSGHYVWVDNLDCYRKVCNLKEGDEIKLKK